MDRGRLLCPLLLFLCAARLQSATADDLQFHLEPSLSDIELFVKYEVNIGLMVTGINCSQPLNGAESISDTITIGDILTGTIPGRIEADYDYAIEARRNLTDIVEMIDDGTTGNDVTTTGNDFITAGSDLTTTGNDLITTGSDVIPVNVTYILDNVGYIHTFQESHILLNGVSDINTQFQITPVTVGPVTVNVTVTWVCQSETHEASASFFGTVRGIDLVNEQAGLRYFTIFLNLICVATIGVQIGPGVLKLPSYGPILSTYLPSQIFMPMVFIFFTALLDLIPAVHAGLLALVISPPGLFVLPMAAIMDADLSLVVTVLVAAPLLSYGVMPLWLVVINGIDPRLGLTAGSVPFGYLFCSFFIPVVSIFFGIFLSSRYPNKMRIFKHALIPLTLLTLFFNMLTVIVGTSKVEIWGGGTLAIISLIQPVVLLVGCMAGQALFRVDLAKMKSIFLLAVLNSEIIGFGLLETALPPRDLAYAVGAANLRSMMVQIFLICFFAIIWGCNFVCSNPHVLIPDRSQAEKERDDESPAKVARDVLMLGLQNQAMSGVNVGLYTPLTGPYSV